MSTIVDPWAVVLFATKRYRHDGGVEYRPGYKHYVDDRCVSSNDNLTDAMASVLDIDLGDRAPSEITCALDGPSRDGVLRAIEVGAWPPSEVVERDDRVIAARRNLTNVRQQASDELGDRANSLWYRQDDLVRRNELDVVQWKQAIDRAQAGLERAQWRALNRDEQRVSADGVSPQRLESIGQTLFGGAWQSELARYLNVNGRSVRRWARDGAPARLATELATLCRERADALRHVADELDGAQ